MALSLVLLHRAGNLLAFVAVSVAAAPLSSAPTFHIDGNHAGAGDLNALFYWRGNYHIMHQYATLPDNCTGWGHLVSPNLLTWTRLPNALSCGPDLYDAHGAWDGSITMPHPSLGIGLNPVIFYDANPQVSRRNMSAGYDMKVSDDPAFIGLARPADPSDPLLTKWAKDSMNPVLQGDKCGTGPSPIWRSGDHLNMIMILNGSEARYQSRDFQHLRQWDLSDPKFMNFRGGGGGLFFPLPGTTAPARYTHMMQTDEGHDDGTCWFVLGVYNSTLETFSSLSAPMSIDFGSNLFSQLGEDPVRGRLLHMGWLADSEPNHLTQMRSVTYDPRVHLLTSNPVEELAGLRSSVLAKCRTTLLKGLCRFEERSAAFDLEADFHIPRLEASISVEFVLSKGRTDGPRVRFDLHRPSTLVPAPEPGLTVLNVSWHVVMTVTRTGARTPFVSEAVPLLSEEKTVQLRMLYDHGILEVFGVHGRAVASTYDPEAAVDGGFVDGLSLPSHAQVAVWSDGSIWGTWGGPAPKDEVMSYNV